MKVPKRRANTRLSLQELDLAYLIDGSAPEKSSEGQSTITAAASQPPIPPRAAHSTPSHSALDSRRQELFVMAPLTRRRKAAQENEPDAEQLVAPKDLSRGKRKSSGEDELEIPESPDKVTPKRQKLAVRVRDDEHPSTDKRRPSTDKKKRSRSLSIADTEDDGDDGEPTPHQVAKQLELEASQQLDQEFKAAEASQKPSSAATTKTGSRIVFGDDDDVDKYVKAAAAVAAENPKSAAAAAADDDELEDDSDDEAPEAVSASAAAKETQQAAQAVADAAEQHAATQKRKRQQRDNKLKQQAQKRKRAEKPGGTEAEAAEAERATTSGRRRAEKFNLPSVLPAEFLTDSESGSEDERALRVAKKPKKINFEDAVQTLKVEGRGPRDEIVGTTAYRVMADQDDQKLPPRANHNSKAVKEMLMQRRRVGVPATKVKGFFKRK
ncbi:uncharacterized protein JN550_007965 [Neoarthrinium moseri]|uniref:uncharacterized protein n=1 Tax=Neoarthrinium moseri TaxID=1658444 RepID=UPI001FDC1CEA|nr:uncharacterized protein JN550_007965 [Neoarthrinium moseri]KAI1865987.1 hypothetical protein JN550_007965 [Neoarthrinium moseri]